MPLTARAFFRASTSAAITTRHRQGTECSISLALGNDPLARVNAVLDVDLEEPDRGPAYRGETDHQSAIPVKMLLPPHAPSPLLDQGQLDAPLKSNFLADKMGHSLT